LTKKLFTQPVTGLYHKLGKSSKTHATDEHATIKYHSQPSLSTLAKHVSELDHFHWLHTHIIGDDMDIIVYNNFKFKI